MRELTIVEEHHVVGATGVDEAVDAANEFCEQNPHGELVHTEEEPAAEGDASVPVASGKASYSGGGSTTHIICDRRFSNGPFIRNDDPPQRDDTRSGH